MGLWNDFTGAISSIPSAAGALVKTISGGGAYLSKDEQEKANTLNTNVKNTLSGIDKQLSNLPQFQAGKKAVSWSGDLLLHAAVALNEKVISPFIMRPLSTVALLTDQQSPLYKKGEYEDGFQFSDIKAAYNRSAKVSAFQAMTKSDLLPGLQMISKAVLSTGDINLDEVNLWNDKSIQQNYVDNAVGRWFTGIGDFAVGTLATAGAGKVVGGVAKFGATKAGVYTATKTVEQLAADMETGILHAASNGTKGTQTVSGSHMTVLAESKDYGVISDIVDKYSTNGKLVQLIHDASSADVVKDMILADKGNIAAMQRLAVAAPDDLFDLSNTSDQLASKFLQTGKVYNPEGPAVPRLKSAYDAAIKKNPQFVKIREAFLDDNYNPLVGGKAYMPMEPKIGVSAVIKGQQVIRDIKGAARFREFDNMGDILSTKVGGKVVTEVVKFVSRQGELKPQGFVTFSGVRPLDGRIELNAFLNNIKLFNDGAKEIVVAPNGLTRKVGDIRRDFEEQYMASIGKNEVETLQAIDDSIGKMIAYKHGIINDAEISGYNRAFRSNIDSGIGGLKANGFAIGHDGRRIEASAQTLRQMEESYRFTPWDSIERQFDMATEGSKLKAGKNVASSAVRQAYKDLTRVWTFDVLVRPMYALKQSIAEPIVSATLAQGTSFIFKDVINNPFSTNGMVGRASKNLSLWTKQKGTNVLTKSEKKAINKFVDDKRKMLSVASENKDLLQAEVESLLRPGGSPAVKKSALVAAKKELDAAERLLDKVELDIRSAVVPYGKAEAMPTLTMLERRVNFIKSKNSISKKNATKLAQAEASITRYKNVVGKMATNKNVLRNADNALAAAYDDIDNILAQLKPALKEQADVFGKTAAYKKRYYSKENQTRIINGEVVSIDSFITGENNFSSAIRAEISNARTVDINYLGELAVGTRQSIIRRRVPTATVKVTDGDYFAELEHIANRIVRQDPLMDQILAGKSIKELKAWASSEQGIRYLEHFDIYEAKQVPAYLADKIALVERTFPSIEARTAILNREVTATELQGWLSNNVDELYDIAPTNFAYGVADAELGGKGYAAAANWLSQSSAAMFRRMASVENPIRNAFFDNAAMDAMARKAQVLMDQGIEMTPARWNALRQSSGREAIQQLEKTIYTVRRENRLLHNLRAVVAFPTATANAFYRYGRLAVNNPTRTAGFLNNYARTFQNFGVDENGNPTEDINSITHLVFPGSREINSALFNSNEGFALNARSVGFMLNLPSPSFISALSVGKAMETFPGNAEDIKSIINIGGVNVFDTIFPYGAPTSVTKAFTPPWANALYNAAVGPEGKADYLASWTSVYNYHKMLTELGIEDKFPSDDQIRNEVRLLWGNKFLSGFVSVAGVPYKVETNPMRLTTNLYYKILERNRAQGMSEQKARDAAGDELLSTMGPGFMLDRVTKTSKNTELSIPATYEGYKRVFEDNDALVGRLATIDADSIGIVSLLTADLSRDPAEQEANILNILKDPNLVLPGTSQRITEFRLTPQEAEAERIKLRTKQQYYLVRDALEAKITDGRTLRAHPELKAVLDNLVETTFKEQSQEWYDEFQLSANGDNSYKYAKALQVITADKNFMKNSGKSQFWHDVSFFTQARNMVAAFYQSIPDYDPRKSQIKDVYNAWVSVNAEQWDPNLQTIVKYYFENDTLKVVS